MSQTGQKEEEDEHIWVQSGVQRARAAGNITVASRICPPRTGDNSKFLEVKEHDYFQKSLENLRVTLESWTSSHSSS